MEEFIKRLQGVLDEIEVILQDFTRFKAEGNDFNQLASMYVIAHLAKGFEHIQKVKSDISFEKDCQDNEEELLTRDTESTEGVQ